MNVLIFNVLGLLLLVPPTDPDFENQWALHNAGQKINGISGVAGADIGALAAWERHPGARPVVVAIISTGVSPHDEFADRLLPGLVTSGAGGDPYSTLDTGQNGTRAAGVIAASRNNGIGIAGLNDRAILLPIRVFNGIQFTPESIAQGITEAVYQGADIALVLVQLYDFHQPIADAVTFAAANDVLVIAAAGHDGTNTVAYPAALDDALAVSATTPLDEPASYSNYGPEVDLSAPGQWIWSTTAAGGYGFEQSGNSFMAAAHVAGVASLIRSYSPQLSAIDTAAILISTAEDLGVPGWDDHFGAGRLNGHAALLAAPTPLLRFEPQGPVPSVVPPLENISFPVRIVNGTGTLSPSSAQVIYRTSAGPFSASTTMQPLGGNLYSAVLPALECSTFLEFYLKAGTQTGQIVTDPSNIALPVYQAVVDPEVDLFFDDFENNHGWETAAGGDATTGLWTRGDPVGTFGASSIPVQPEYDASQDEGTLCFFTGQHFGGNPGTNDVDGGPVTLTSPVIEIGAQPSVNVRFWYWFYSTGGVIDTLDLAASRDAGANWTQVVSLPPTTGWHSYEFSVADSGSQLRVRLTVSDIANDSLTEAAIDEFRVFRVECGPMLGDVNGDGNVNLRDLGVLGGCLTGPLANRTPACGGSDLNNDLHVDLRDVAILARSF